MGPKSRKRGTRRVVVPVVFPSRAANFVLSSLVGESSHTRSQPFCCLALHATDILCGTPRFLIYHVLSFSLKDCLCAVFWFRVARGRMSWVRFLGVGEARPTLNKDCKNFVLFFLKMEPRSPCDWERCLCDLKGAPPHPKSVSSETWVPGSLLLFCQCVWSLSACLPLRASQIDFPQQKAYIHCFLHVSFILSTILAHESENACWAVASDRPKHDVTLLACRERCASSCDHCVDFRIPGIPHSAAEQVETNRKEKVRRLIERIESHPSRNILLKDFEKSEEINHFSQDSKDLITEVCNNEIFEFYETSSKRQCPDCASYWEIRLVFCTCGKCKQPTAMNRQYNKDRYDSLSIPGYLIKKNQSRGPWNGQSMRQIMYHGAHDMLRKAKPPMNGSCETILERWYTDADCQKSLSDEDWTEEKIRQYDALALEDQSF